MRSLIAVLLALAVTEVSAQQSLRVAALANGGEATNVIDYAEPLMTLARVIEDSDLILHGRITNSRSVLFRDDRYVGTDYTVLPLRVMKQNPALNIAPRPGLPPSAAVVRRMGGTLVEGRSRYTTKTSSFPEAEAPRVGEEVVWFLRYDSKLEVFVLAGGQFGSFRIEGGQICPHTTAVAARRGDRPTDTSSFLVEIQERIEGRRRDQ